MSPRRRPEPMTRAAEDALRRMGMDAGSAVREARHRRRWTMDQLSDRAGVAHGAVQAVESGRIGTLETYARLATALGLRPSLVLDSRRPTSGSHRSEAEDFVHASMGELEARRLRETGPTVAIDEPYQHYQFAGRADVLAWQDRDLLHIENRTRFPNIQEAAGAYNAKRRYLASALADRLSIGARGWRSVTHALVCLWSSEVLHVLRLRPATFAALCPDGSDAIEDWLRGQRPAPGVSSTLILLDPLVPPGSRRRSIATLDAVPRLEPRYRDYADAADQLRRAADTR